MTHQTKETYESYEEKIEPLYKKILNLLFELKKDLQNKPTSEQLSLDFYTYIYNHYNKNKSGNIFLPLPKEEWSRPFNQLSPDSQLTWPHYTAYNYSMDVLFDSINVDNLCFGFALYQDKLVSCAFFTTLKVLTYSPSEGISFPMPAHYALDPLAELHKVKPQCYIGISIPREFIENWLLNGKRNASTFPPLVYVAKMISDKKEAEEKAIAERKIREQEYEERKKREKEEALLNDKTKKLFLIRHGDPNYDKDQNDLGLSDSGKEQINKLALVLSKNLGKRPVILWTSSAPRAIETAEIIKKFLNVEMFEMKEKLWSDNKHTQDFEWFEKEINRHHQNKSVLIIISHLEYVQRFPSFLNSYFELNNSDRACGVLIEDDTRIKEVVYYMNIR